MKKMIIFSGATLVLIALGFFVFSETTARGDPCARIFEQTAIGLKSKINLLKEKGEVTLGKQQVEKLSDQSDQIAVDLKTCCILFHEDKIAFDEFLNCQDDFNRYESQIERVVHFVDEARGAKQQERYDLANLRLKDLERHIKYLDAISDHFQLQLKSLLVRPAKEDGKPVNVVRKSVMTEIEPNDSYNQGMEISIGVLTGLLTRDDRQDYFRFELGPGRVLTLDFTAGDESESMKIALRNFEGDDLWNSDETPSGVTKSTRMMMNNLSGGIYYAVVHSGIGPYKLDLYIEDQNDAGSGTDAGDQIAKAIEINPGRSYLGELGGFDEQDWYRFDIRPGHVLKLALMPSRKSEAMKFSLRSFERSEAWYSGIVSPGDQRPKRMMMNNSSGGTYYLHAYYGSGQYKFEIFTESQNDASSGTDAGDKIAEALKIEPGRAYSGELGGYDEKDWYRFDIPAGSILRMAFATSEGGEPMQFSFRNFKRDEVWHSEEMPPNATASTRLITNNVSGGTYFLEAFHGSGPYEFEIFLESQNDAGLGSDAGDGIAEAIKITPGRLISGELGSLDKEDWYTFSPQKGKTIQFTSDKKGEPLKLSLGNVAHREGLYFAELTPGVTEAFEIPGNVAPPYFLKVYGGSNKYRFEIK